MTLIKRKSNLRRNRGEAGSDKNVSAYSYRNLRSETEDSTGRDPHRSLLNENKLSHFLNRVGATIFLLVCAISLFSLLSLSPEPHITLVGGQSNNVLYKLYKPALLARSQKLFSSSVFNRDKITVNTNGISQRLASEFPEFSQITISMPFIGQHPILYVTQATPAVVLENSLGQYLLNQNGVAMLYGAVSNGFNYLNLPMIEDLSGLDIHLGQVALTPQNISFIQTVNIQLSLKHYTITSYILPAGSSELDVKLTGLPYTVKFNLESNDPKVQTGRYLAVANYFKSKNINPSQSVDVRTGGRVYYN